MIMYDEKYEIDRVLWDLDGTILNPRMRLYTLFRELTGCGLEYEQYWAFKELGYNQAQMLSVTGCEEDAAVFHRKWLDNVERTDLLKMDTLFEDALTALEYLQSVGKEMYLITNRQNYKNLLNQLEDMEIKKYFTDIFSTFQTCSKAEKIKQQNIDLRRTALVGDSLEDMKAARKLGIKAILVCRKQAPPGQDRNADIQIPGLTELDRILS